MTEEDEYQSTDERITATGPERGPGQELAAARERAGISFETMAEGLRLPKRQLEALEADDYASLPPPTYVRGYIRAYAREVGLDGDDIVALFDADHGDLHDPDLHPAVPSGSAAGGGGLPIGLAVIAVVVIAGIGGWWWQGRPPADAGTPGGDMPAAESTGQADTGQDAADGSSDDAETRAAATTPDDEPAQSERVAEAAAAEGGTSPPAPPEPQGAGAEAPESPATPEDDMAAGTGGAGDTAGTDEAVDTDATAGDAGAAREAAGAEGDEATGQAAGAAQEAAGTAAPEGEQQEGAGLQVAEGGQQEGADTEETAARQHDSPSATSDPEEAATPAAAVGPDTLVLRVDGRSWMEVYDAGERELVYTLYLGSEPVRLQGWAPFDVFLGNSPAVTVTLNGQEVAKSAFTRSDNTARFLVDEDGARRR